MQPPVHLTKEDYFPDSDFHLRGYCCKEKGIPNGKNLTYINHYHAFSELVLILGGNAIQNINGKDYHVERGDLFLLEGNTAHFFRPGTEFSLFNVLFDKETLPLPWSLYRQSNGYNLFFEVEPKARTPRSFKNRLKLKNEDTDFVYEKLSLITHKLSQARKTQDILLKTEALCCFGECIIFISRLFETYENSQEAVISGVSRVIAMLEEHFAEEFSLEAMAKKACTSPRNFS